MRNFSLIPLAFIGNGLSLWRIMAAAKTLSYGEKRNQADELTFGRNRMAF